MIIKKKRVILLMEKRVESGLGGMRTDKRGLKKITRMGNLMDYGLRGIRMDRKIG